MGYSCGLEMATANKILKEVTWLTGLVGAHDIFGEEIPKKLKHCHSLASEHQLQKQKAVRLGAGLEACQRALSTAGAEGFHFFKILMQSRIFATAFNIVKVCG